MARKEGKGWKSPVFMLKRWDLEDGSGVSKLDLGRDLCCHVGWGVGNTDGLIRGRTVRRL